MVIIFDLDYTLLDTAAFREAGVDYMAVSREDYEETCTDVFKNKNRHYNFYVHADELVRQGKISRERGGELRKNISAFLKKIDSFVFPGVEEILKKLKTEKKYLVLMSRGDLIWQKEKIKNLTIKKYFDRIIITDKKKDGALDEFRKMSKKIIIVNDNAAESAEMKKLLPSAQVILVRGPYSGKGQEGFFMIDSAGNLVKNPLCK